MEILGKILYFVVMMLAIKYFDVIVGKAESKNISRRKRTVIRAIVIIVFLIAIVSLFAYSILAAEEGMARRVISGILALVMLIYLINLIRRYREIK
ncbi:hypothetical protein [Anaerococcus cruorum]|uniref:Uncharacterized protein n=1 Tax=Anaerococcus cruorum TaxID=3115617 RepID=A0ABW9MXW4_9FIRM